jgi:oligoribonuclease
MVRSVPYHSFGRRLVATKSIMAQLITSHPLVWIDCEVYIQPTELPAVRHIDAPQMTGLDVDSDVIIEIFCIITNGNLDILDENGWGAVIHQSKETMDKMVQISPLSGRRTD